MKRNTLIALTLAIVMSCSPITFAHSGRTDANGGHRDNNNVSGLGSYHYHHGYPAHLHPNGVCPYSTPSKPATTNSTPAPTAKPFVPSIVGTNVRTFINGSEAPTWGYNGSNSCAVIIAEDMACYGFDVTWEPASKTLIVTKNNDKSIMPIPMQSYRNLAKGATAFNIYNNNVSILLKSGDATYYPAAIYNLGGYMAVSVDELKLFGSVLWDGSTSTITINTR